MSLETEPTAGPSEPLGPTCANHPDRPSVGTCEHCGTFSCGACLGWLGSRQICATCVREDRVSVFGLPWDDRANLGMLRAWAQTAGMLAVQPVDYFRKLDPHAPIGGAVLFALISTAWLAIFYFGLVTCIGGAVGIFIAAGEIPWEPEMGLVMAFVGAIYTIIPPVWLLVMMFVWALVHHVVMLLVGGGRQGVGATLRVVLMTSPVQILQLIPCCNYVAWAWYLPLQGIGYTQIHEQDGWKSALGILIPFAVCIACYIVYIIFIISLEGF